MRLYALYGVRALDAALHAQDRAAQEMRPCRPEAVQGPGIMIAGTLLPPSSLAKASRLKFWHQRASCHLGCLSAVDSAAKKLWVSCNTKHLSDRYPAEGVIDYAMEANCDLIVMASHGRRGIKRLSMGRQAIDVLTHSSVPVLICRPRNNCGRPEDRRYSSPKLCKFFAISRESGRCLA